MIRIPCVEPKSRRIQRLSLTPELLLAWLLEMEEPRVYLQSGLPRDARLVDCSYDERARLIRLAIESESFRPVEPGNELMEMSVQFSTHEMYPAPSTDDAAIQAFLSGFHAGQTVKK